jgi:DNA-binding transcriptional ArsR family regulator
VADSHREFKNRLYAQFARVGKALASPHRLELLELLGQGERTVDSLAGEIGISIANASQHLQTLRQAALVESRKQGQFVYYRLADPGISDLCRVVRTVSERRLAELDRWCGIISAIVPASPCPSRNSSSALGLRMS